jgi:transcriptional regulator with XRE-family HTH domain
MFLISRQMAAEKKSRARKGPEVPIEMSGLPERLTRAMQAAEVDQVKLAALARVSQGSISKLLSGDSVKGATAVVVARLALALRVPSGWLLTGEGDVVPRVQARAEGTGPVVELVEGRDPLVPPAPQLPPVDAPAFPEHEAPSQQTR